MSGGAGENGRTQSAIADHPPGRDLERATMIEGDEPAKADEAPARVRKCPICGKPRVDRYRPFCSKRCAEVDLHRWFTGAYAIPAVEEDASAEGDDDGRES